MASRAGAKIQHGVSNSPLAGPRHRFKDPDDTLRRLGKHRFDFAQGLREATPTRRTACGSRLPLTSQ